LWWVFTTKKDFIDKMKGLPLETPVTEKDQNLNIEL
jgi:hypothetical protein